MKTQMKHIVQGTHTQGNQTKCRWSYCFIRIVDAEKNIHVHFNI